VVGGQARKASGPRPPVGRPTETKQADPHRQSTRVMTHEFDQKDMAREIVDDRVDERVEERDGKRKREEEPTEEALKKAHDEGFERGRKLAHSMAEMLTIASIAIPKFEAIRNANRYSHDGQANATLALAAVEHQKTISMFAGMAMIAQAIERSKK